MVESNSIRQRVKTEFIEYLTISAYLLICFSILFLYEHSILEKQVSPLVPLSVAVVKALLIGKFIMISRVVGVGERATPNVLLHRIAWKSVATLVALLIFVSLEELVVGLVHGHQVSDIVNEFMVKSGAEKLAPSLVMLLVIIPLITYEEVDAALGKGKIRSMLFESHP